MSTATPRDSHRPLHPALNLLFAFTILTAVLATGCGSSSSQAPGPALQGNTSVTLLLSSTANAQLSQFNLGFNSVSLTSQSGKKVDLFTTTQDAEFIHLNGATEPLLTVTVPQDVYTAATASIGPADFTCSTLDPSGGLDISTFAYEYVPAPQVTVTLPEPITVTGKAMGLLLDMQVSPSASYPSTCYVRGIEPFSINPTFNLAAVAFSRPLAEPLLDGKIASVNPADNSFTLVLAGGRPLFGVLADRQPLLVKTNNSTVYQGINGLSLLTVGTLVDMDAVIQSDGSQLASRIAVEDTDTTNLSVSTGPLLQVAASQPSLLGSGRQNQGYLAASNQVSELMPYSFGNAVFQISGRFTNLQTLPFVTGFDAANIFDGQNVYVTSHATILQGGPIYFPATTITLIPQTINGTISGISSDGGFTTYTVALAPYGLIPNLAVQAGQTTVLTDPSNVVVYVDSNTQLLNTQPLAAGNGARFNGMLFNDNGTLRMDCGQVNDGVAVQPGTQSAEGSSSLSAQKRIFSRHVSGTREAVSVFH